jgi:hypothetical protein
LSSALAGLSCPSAGNALPPSATFGWSAAGGGADALSVVSLSCCGLPLSRAGLALFAGRSVEAGRLSCAYTSAKLEPLSPVAFAESCAALDGVALGLGAGVGDNKISGATAIGTLRSY